MHRTGTVQIIVIIMMMMMMMMMIIIITMMTTIIMIYHDMMVTCAARYLLNLVMPSVCMARRGKILKNLSTEATSWECTAASNLLCTMFFSLSSDSYSSLNDVSRVLPGTESSHRLYRHVSISIDITVFIGQCQAELRAFTVFTDINEY